MDFQRALEESSNLISATKIMEMFTNQNRQVVRRIFLDEEDADDDDEMKAFIGSPIRIKNEMKDETRIVISSTPKVSADSRDPKSSDFFLDNNTSLALSPIAQAHEKVEKKVMLRNHNKK